MAAVRFIQDDDAVGRLQGVYVGRLFVECPGLHREPVLAPHLSRLLVHSPMYLEAWPLIGGGKLPSQGCLPDAGGAEHFQVDGLPLIG